MCAKRQAVKLACWAQELTAAPSIDDIVHFDSWARTWTAEHATSFRAKKQVVLK